MIADELIFTGEHIEERVETSVESKIRAPSYPQNLHMDLR